MKNKEIKILDLVDYMRLNKNITKCNLIRVLKALPKVIRAMLLDKKEVSFIGFITLGFRHAKDRIVKTRECKKRNIKSEILHMPAHKRFKASFYSETKKYLNEKKEFPKK